MGISDWSSDVCSSDLEGAARRRVGLRPEGRSPVRGGARAGGFPGADAILRQLEEGAARRRVGLRPEGRAPVRSGAALFVAVEGGAQIGVVTSGAFGPSIEGPVAMGYVETALSSPGNPV